MADLLVTLGHNSSAILVNDGGEIICGYENERISGIKSDSHFPIQAITECLRHTDEEVSGIYTTHWEPTNQLYNAKKKHWDPDSLPINVPIITHSNHVTHHDTHAEAARHFAGPNFPKDNAFVLVIDGFGNLGEHLSVYKLKDDNELDIKFRSFGYNNSLGLLYQYMTAYLGLKMNQDEYKLLGYEAHIHEVDVDLPVIQEEAYKFASKLIDGIFNGATNISPYDPLINITALPQLQHDYIVYFERLLDRWALIRPTDFDSRVAFSFFVQSVLESTVLAVVKAFNIKNLIVSGGVFYNVKLNYRLIQEVPGKFCAYPLSGDQGNAIGLYNMCTNKLKPYQSINWGIRNLRPDPDTFIEGLYFMREDKAVPFILDNITTYGAVNVVRGNMEYGPRALCNTSTLALPDPHIVRQINHANGRSTIMPMAPVMSRKTYVDIFENTDKVWRSEEFMITALKYKPGEGPLYEGAAHKYKDEYTGRPQVISDPLMDDILDYYPLLINTSFNIHGKPIAYDIDSVIENHLGQIAVDPTFKTVVIGE